MKSSVPPLRVRDVNERPVRSDGDFVLYWMIANRRTRSNFALDRAIDWAVELGKPLRVLEALRLDYRWASARHHRFVIDGMFDNAAALGPTPVGYHAYVEPAIGAGRGLLEKLGESAAVVVTDDFPCFFLPRMVGAAGERLSVRLEAVDSNGLLPVAAAGRAFARAFDFRRFVQRELPDHIDARPLSDPLARLDLPGAGELPSAITSRWPAVAESLLAPGASLADLPVDRAVPPVDKRGGAAGAASALQRFAESALGSYDEERNLPDRHATSELSPYLHYGHLSAHEALERLASEHGWTSDDLSQTTAGKRTGWWNLPTGTEAFLDQLVTWRELGYGFCANVPDYDRYESLPEWARATLAEHAADPRPVVYDSSQFERAQTHDDLWNAAQLELVTEGRIHNYLRMLWGKKILHWSATPQQAWTTMIELNNKYALDGRNPNSYSGISWVMGRFDRPWGPERPIFGKVRYMTSSNTRRKLKVGAYIERHLRPGLFEAGE